jgi:UDP-N-acetylglucosamine transferase subunit ALG13
VVQHGHSAPIGRPNCELVEFLPFETLVETMRRARVVVTHAGVGSVMVALSTGRRPVVVPRRHSLGEAVDDHQLQLGRRFAQAGLVTLVEDESALGAALGPQQAAPALARAGTALARDLRRFLEDIVVQAQART